MNLSQLKILLPFLFFCSLVYFSYSEKAFSDNVNNGVRTGNISFYRDASTKGVGKVKFYLDNVFVGSSNETFIFQPSCYAFGTVATTRIAGRYSYQAKSDSGDVWNGYVTIVAGDCTSYRIRR